MKNRFLKPFRIHIHKCEESFETLYNAERGWYFITRIELDETIQIPESYLHSRNGLELLEINLMKYNEGPLTKQALKQLHDLFCLSREAKKKLILRFTYDMIGNCPATEPKEISIIFQHMEDLKDLFYEFQDNIFLYQGIFMGSWGEMHDSKYANTVDIQKLFQKLASVTPDNAFIAVRTPALYRTIAQCLGVCYKKDSSKGKGFYRLAIFNDSFVSSDTDYGTYGSVRKEYAKHYYEKWCREDELNFQQELTRRTPSGGETSALYEEMSMEEVVSELRKAGITYLNNEYHPAVMERWQTTMIESGPYKGKSYYDYIGDHMGYRFVIQEVKATQKKKNIILHIGLVNKGCAPIYRDKTLRLLLKSEDTQLIYRSNQELALFQEGILEMEFLIDTERLQASQYNIYFQIYDDVSEQLIACANHRFDYVLGNEIGTIQKR